VRAGDRSVPSLTPLCFGSGEPEEAAETPAPGRSPVLPDVTRKRGERNPLQEIAAMALRLVAFVLDGTPIRGDNSIAVVGGALGHREWESRMEILHMREESPEARRSRAAPWLGFSRDELCRPPAGAGLAPGVDEAFRILHERSVTTAIVAIS
jgi:hypothetical protein